ACAGSSSLVRVLSWFVPVRGAELLVEHHGRHDRVQARHLVVVQPEPNRCSLSSLLAPCDDVAADPQVRVLPAGRVPPVTGPVHGGRSAAGVEVHDLTHHAPPSRSPNRGYLRVCALKVRVLSSTSSKHQVTWTVPAASLCFLVGSSSSSSSTRSMISVASALW